MKNELLIMIPTYNEVENAPRIFLEIVATGVPADVLFIDEIHTLVGAGAARRAGDAGADPAARAARAAPQNGACEDLANMLHHVVPLLNGADDFDDAHARPPDPQHFSDRERSPRSAGCKTCCDLGPIPGRIHDQNV